MVARIHWLREICFLFLWASIVGVVLLLVVAPVHSMAQLPPPSQQVELMEESQPVSGALMLFLALQVVVLALMMISYLTISSSIAAKTDSLRHHHRWNHLHFHRR